MKYYLDNDRKLAIFLIGPYIIYRGIDILDYILIYFGIYLIIYNLFFFSLYSNKNIIF